MGLRFRLRLEECSKGFRDDMCGAASGYGIPGKEG